MSSTQQSQCFPTHGGKISAQPRGLHVVPIRVFSAAPRRRVRRSGTPVLLAQLQLSQRSCRRRGQRSHRPIVNVCVTESFMRIWISMRRAPLHNEDFIPTETPSVTLTLRLADCPHHKNTSAQTGRATTDGLGLNPTAAPALCDDPAFLVLHERVHPSCTHLKSVWLNAQVKHPKCFPLTQYVTNMLLHNSIQRRWLTHHRRQRPQRPKQ